MLRDPVPPTRTEPPEPPGWRWAAATVHLFTASGAVCALFAIHAVLNGSYETAFVWLGVALIIDGIDGAFARALDVGRRLPDFSGEKLDLVVDYVTYVFVPALALQLGGYLTGAWGGILAGLILLSSLFHFSHLGSKADDHCFVGFPAVWNVVAFYIFAFAPPGWVVSGIILLCVGLTFVPMRWLHPMRVVQFRAVNIAMCLLWGGAAIWTLSTGFPAHVVAMTVLALAAIYVTGLSVLWPLIGGDAEN
jgi:phosphatidylcholine synthase